MSKSPIIVSLGVGQKYPAYLDRLRESCLKFEVEHWLWRKYPPGARLHKESPYGFKIHVIRQALQRGFETIVWADSAAYVVRDPSPFFRLVKERGILFLGHGDQLHRYVNDRSLELFGFKRDDVKRRWLVSGTIFGLDFGYETTHDFFEEWASYERDGWFKTDGQKPKGDFLEHRHDEAMVSLMLMKYEIDTPAYDDHLNSDRESVTFRAGKDL